MQQMELRNVIIAPFLAITWMILTGQPTLEGFIIGIVVGLLVARLTALSVERESSPSADGIPGFFRFILSLLRQIIVADIDVARRILSDEQPKNDGMVEVSVGTEYETIAAISAYSITAAPGSLVVDFSEDGQCMIVHMIDKTGELQLRREQEERIEPLLKVMKGNTNAE